MRRSKSKAIKQGSIKDIYKLFIWPFIKYVKPKKMNIPDFLDEIFHLETRMIEEYVVKKAFKMPGKLKITALKAMPGISNLRVTPGTRFYVRVDKTIPEIIDVEVLSRGHQETLFQLNWFEWLQIKGMYADKVARVFHQRKRKKKRNS